MMDSQTPLEIELPRSVEAPARARRWLEESYTAELDSDEIDAAKLLTSELVNNAVLHGRGRIMLRAALDENRLLVEVMDEGSGFERLIQAHDFERIGGRGLQVVEDVSSRWGVHQGTTHVWFELERPGPRLGVESKPALDG